MCEVLTEMFFLPIQLAIGLFIMYNEIGWSFLLGLGAMLFMSVLNFFIGKSSIKLQKLYMKEKDKRIKVTTEIFNSIKFVKVNAWEEYFYDKLNAQREKELAIQRRRIYISIVQITSIWFTPVLVINVTFMYFIYLGSVLTTEQAFVVIALFNIL